MIVAISGKRGNGKDTFAALLKEEHFPEAIISPVANEFKRLFAMKFGLDYERLIKDREYKEKHRECMNQFFEKVHSESPGSEMYQLLSTLDSSSFVVIPDLRLKSHLQILKEECDRREKRLWLIRIECSPSVKTRFGWCANSAVDSHWTETELDDETSFDWIVHNDGHIQSLRENAAAFVHHIRLHK